MLEVCLSLKVTAITETFCQFTCPNIAIPFTGSFFADSYRNKSLK